MPRWKSESGFSLKRELSALGMEKAFSPAAEFGGMTDKGDIQVSEVVHKAFVEVTEQGTEAAAATGALMAATAAAPDPKPPVVFRADHPFLYVLRDTQTGAILFLGRLMKP
jgi:serpin B